MTAMRASPVARALATLGVTWQDHRGMPMAMRVGDDDGAVASRLGVCDLSALTRTGLKGPGAASWLAARGIDVPDHPNTWVPLAGGGLIARLARSEFLLEDGPAGDTAIRLAAELHAGIDGVTPVRRQDCALALVGDRVGELLAQTCNVDFSSRPTGHRAVTLTMMVGLSVAILRREAASMPGYRLWCDATAGAYLWETLTQIAGELGGGPVGAALLLDSFTPP